MFGKNKEKQSHGSIESRVAAIRSLSAALTSIRENMKREHSSRA